MQKLPFQVEEGGQVFLREELTSTITDSLRALGNRKARLRVGLQCFGRGPDNEPLSSYYMPSLDEFNEQIAIVTSLVGQRVYDVDVQRAALRESGEMVLTVLDVPALWPIITRLSRS